METFISFIYATNCYKIRSICEFIVIEILLFSSDLGGVAAILKYYFLSLLW